MIIIPNQASDNENFQRKYSLHKNARTAWGAIIDHYLQQDPETVFLLPAYIGYSLKEGSGIFDPIKYHNAKYEFYGLNSELQIDVGDLKKKYRNSRCPTVVLLVHYFGFLDMNYQKICDWLDSKTANYVEDCAHAMLTDLIGGGCGRRGQYSFYSIHKLLPLDSGGVLVANRKSSIINATLPSELDSLDIYSFDLRKISDKRRENYTYLLKLLNRASEIEILHPILQDNIVPQTFPVLIKSSNRDEIYFQMNSEGFGFVSLYHTMIDELVGSHYKSANFTANHITNLPIHQDCNSNDIMKMADKFLSVLHEK